MAPDPQLATDSPPRGDFDADLRASMLRLKDAYTGLLASLGADPARPQDMSRRFGINRNLAWKLSKIVHASDPTRVVGHLPGPSGRRILLDTCREHRAAADAIARVEQASAGLDDVVARHAGDRSALQLLLASREASANLDHQEASRRQAFNGNCAIWGVQARLHVGLFVHRPNEHDDQLVDGTSVGGLLDVRRLRGAASWPLVRHSSWRRDADGVVHNPVEALDPAAAPDGPPLVTPFSSVDPERLRRVPTSQGDLWELGEGPVGLTGMVDGIFGRRARAAGRRWAGEQDDAAYAAVPLNTPVEAVQIDVLVHRDLPYADVRPSAQILSRLESGEDFAPDPASRHLLPCPAEVQDLGAGPPALASPRMRRYVDLVDWTLERLGARADEFRAWRLDLAFPAIPTTPALRIPLPERGG